MEAFRRAGADIVSAIDEIERSVLISIVEDVEALLSPDESAAQPGVVDPAVMRVFPPASLEDPELAEEIRVLTHADVSNTKLQSLGVVAQELRTGRHRVVVGVGAVEHWLRALNDVRLVLSERLGISDDADAERFYEIALAATQSDEPEDTCGDEQTVAMASLYAGITWWQGSLLDALGTTGT